MTTLRRINRWLYTRGGRATLFAFMVWGAFDTSLAQTIVVLCLLDAILPETRHPDDT